MKRLLNIGLLLSIALLGATAQVSLQASDIIQPPPNGTFLNGSGAYHFRTSPSKTDLNGSESLANTTFDANTTGWSVLSAGAISHNTNLDRVRTGAGSLQYVVTSSPPGNNGVVASISPASNTSTDKFTWEAWCYVPATDSLRKVRIAIVTQAGASFGASSDLTLTANTWTKVVANGQAPGTQTGIFVRVQLLSGGLNDTLYVDDVSLKQGWDGVASIRVKTSSGSTQTIAGSSVTNSSRLRIWQNTATASVSLTDGVTTVTATNSATINDGREHQWDVTWSRTGNLTLYIDGVAGTGQSITGIGVVTIDTLWIGRDQTGNYSTGTIGEKLRVRYSSLPSDIASWITAAANSKFIPFPPLSGGGEIVFWTDWQSGGYDKSGNGNHLTPVGGAAWGPIN